jgi:glutamate-1-semialdehyde 2,1-aminomutase
MDADGIAAALAQATERYIHANPQSGRRHQKALSVMPGGSTRTVLSYPPFPIALSRGEGAYLVDFDEHRYTDLLGEFSAGLYGHSHPVLLEAAREALADGLGLGGPNRYEAEFARVLTTRFPSCQLIRFCNSGTEANLMAIAAARHYTGRAGILVFQGGYHGGVLNFGQVVSSINVPIPAVVAQYNDMDGTAKLLQEHAHDLAAVLVEPMMGSAGGIPASREFLAMLAEQAAAHRLVLIFDEVMTSRCAPGGLQGQLGFRPDLTTFGKYLGGGFSFGAFGGRADIMQLFDTTRTGSLPHAGTFNNNVMSMAAGHAGLSRVYTPEVAAALDARGDALRTKLNQILEELQADAQVTGTGSLLNVHFQRSPIRTPRDIVPALDARSLFHLEMLHRGFYLSRRGFITLSIVLTPQDLDNFASAFAEVFSKR